VPAPTASAPPNLRCPRSCSPTLSTDMPPSPALSSPPQLRTTVAPLSRSTASVPVRFPVRDSLRQHSGTSRPKSSAADARGQSHLPAHSKAPHRHLRVPDSLPPLSLPLRAPPPFHGTRATRGRKTASGTLTTLATILPHPLRSHQEQRLYSSTPPTSAPLSPFTVDVPSGSRSRSTMPLPIWPPCGCPRKPVYILPCSRGLGSFPACFFHSGSSGKSGLQGWACFC
jgi:hypothetical protein